MQDIFYSIFFGVVNLLIYFKLQKSYQPQKMYLYVGSIVIIIIIHFFGKHEYLMSTEDFMNLSFFSVALIVLHFATNVQVSLFKKYNVTQNEQAEKLQSKLLMVFDFMRQRLIYIMIYLYQFLAVWNESYR